MCCLFLLSVGEDFVRIQPRSNDIPLGCVHTWSPSTGCWTSVQNSVAFRHWILQVFKYHLVSQYKVETLHSGSGTVTFPIFWCKYEKRKNGVFALVPNGNRERAPCWGAKCEHGLGCYNRFGCAHDLFGQEGSELSQSGQQTSASGCPKT